MLLREEATEGHASVAAGEERATGVERGKPPGVAGGAVLLRCAPTDY
jgi:hypothetical protein